MQQRMLVAGRRGRGGIGGEGRRGRQGHGGGEGEGEAGATHGGWIAWSNERGQMTEEFDRSKPAWEPMFAKEAIGRTVLIGSTFCDPPGEPERREQLYGAIIEADEIDGFLVELEGERHGETYRLPPTPAR